jgi:hypothetical protein
MNRAETIDAQVTLPAELYHIIEQRAITHGHSISSEVVVLLSSLLPVSKDELEQEIVEWEAASDEDWQAMEAVLLTEGS